MVEVKNGFVSRRMYVVSRCSVWKIATVRASEQWGIVARSEEREIKDKKKRGEYGGRKQGVS
jgi:hypothetical protein